MLWEPCLKLYKSSLKCKGKKSNKKNSKKKNKLSKLQNTFFFPVFSKKNPNIMN
jgi:hypothetical protein